jgi:hypothetical protein
MWVLKGNNITKCNLAIIDASIAWLANKTNENFGKLMRVLQGENNIKCNMKYLYVGIPYSNKCYVYC